MEDDVLLIEKHIQESSLVQHKQAINSGFALNTSVLMFNGEIKPIHTLTPGEQLMGDDNTPRSVVAIQRIPSPSFYRIKQIKGTDYTINQDNFISLKLSRVKASTMICGKKYVKNDIVDITLQDYLNLSRNKRNDLKAYKTAVDFSFQKHLKLNPYVFGMWIIDATETNLSEISVHDLDILAALLADLDKEQMKLEFIRDNRFQIVLNNEKNFYEEILQPLGIQETKFIPQLYKTNDRNTRLQILAGIIDCEGYLNNNCYELTIKSEKVADDIVFITLSLGLYASKNEQKQKQYYRIIISGDLSQIPTKTRRIKERKQIKNILHTGFTVNQLNEVNECVKITIDGNGRFLLNDFTVIHS